MLVLASALAAPAVAGSADATADVELTASAGGDVERDVTVERSVTVRNVGAASASDVHVFAQLAPGVRFATVLPVFEGGTCTLLSIADPHGSSMLADCRRSSLAPGRAATLQMSLVATPTADCGSIATTVEATADDEPTSAVDAQNSATIADQLVCAGDPGPDLAIAASASGDGPFVVRSPITFALEVRNVGDASASDVDVAALLPRGVVVRALPTGEGARCGVASYLPSDGPPVWAVACSLPTLDAGAVTTIRIPARVHSEAPCRDVRLLATVESDDEPAALRGPENRADVSTALACRPEVHTTVRTPPAVHSGSMIPVEILVRNVSGADIVDVRPRAAGCGGRLRRVDDGTGDATLGPRERWTYRCRRAVGGSDPVPVSVAVSARDDVRQSAVDRAFARVDVWHPSIALAIEEQVRTAAPGSVVPIDATVTNAGDTPLLDVRLEVPGSGVVARLPSIAPGTSRTVHAQMSLPTSSGSVGSATVIARDRLGRTVSASTATPYVVASAGNAGQDAGGGGHPSARPNGSAFSGASVGSRIALALCLAGLGAVALVASRRRRSTA